MTGACQVARKPRGGLGAGMGQGFPRHFRLQNCRRLGIALGVTPKSDQRAFRSYEGSDSDLLTFGAVSFQLVRSGFCH